MIIENPVIHVPIRHLYNCRGFSTNQLFFNKQSQFRESSNERKYLLYKGLSNFIPLAGQKNKPKSNPIKPNSQKAQMNINLTLKKDYIKNDDFVVRINKPNFRNGQNECNLKYNKGLWQFSDRDHEKTNPNKPNFKRCTNLGTGSLYRFTPGVLRKFFNKKVDEAIQVVKAFTKPLKKLTERAGFEPAVQVYARTTV